MHKLHIARDDEYIYYLIDKEMDLSDVNVKQKAIVDVTEEDLCHLLALRPFWKSKELEDLLNANADGERTDL